MMNDVSCLIEVDRLKKKKSFGGHHRSTDYIKNVIGSKNLRV